jgi:pimeloyl-ACP methyl ester carboxylesterase
VVATLCRTSLNSALNSFTHGFNLAYRTYGSGPVHFICFHGFSRSGGDFWFLGNALGRRCTFHAFDLHFHGSSLGDPQRADNPFTSDELAGFFSAFADAHDREKICLLGYSLGGRMALSLLETMPHRVEHAFLVAPDGLKMRPWYRGLAASAVGRTLYKRFVDRPQSFHKLVQGLRRMNVVNDRMVDFVMRHTSARERRQLLHDVWLSYRLIEPDLRRVAQNLHTHDVMAHLIFGEYDRVIPPRLGRNLKLLAPRHVTEEVLPAGHWLLGYPLPNMIAHHLDKGSQA